MIVLLLVSGTLSLAGCGNKGPLVRPSATPAKPASMARPAPVAMPASATRPAVATTVHAPAYLSPPMPSDANGHAH
ncbi:MAG TPA: lipoprotein [Rhodanobacteraceae bacterium]